jgi:hypothetical protein
LVSLTVGVECGVPRKREDKSVSLDIILHLFIILSNMKNAQKVSVIDRSAVQCWYGYQAIRRKNETSRGVFPR